MDSVAGALTGNVDQGGAPPVDPRAFDVGAAVKPGAGEVIPPSQSAQPVKGAIAQPSSKGSVTDAAPNPDAQHTLVGRIFHGALSTLGGGDQVGYSRDANGNMVETRTPGTPGQWARNIIAGALTGMAAGAQAPRGSGPFGAIGVGAQARMGQVQQQDRQKREDADKDFETQRKTATENAQMAMLTQQTAAAAWGLKDKQVDAAFKLADSEHDFAARVASNPENRDLGVYSDLDELIKAHKEIAPDLIQAHLKGTLVGHPAVDAQHNVTGMHFAILNPDWMNKATTEDTRIQTFKPPSKAGEKPSFTEQVIPAGAITNGDAFKVKMATDAPGMKWYQEQESNRMEQERIDKAGEVTPALRFKEANENYRKKLEVAEKNGGGLQDLHDPFGDPLGRTVDGQQLNRKEFDASQKTFSHEYVQPLNVLKKTLQEFDRIDKNPHQTGAEKVTALLSAVGISGDPLKGKGFRITNDIIKEHASSRNVWESGVQKLNTIAGSGGPITSKQISDYRAVAEGVVHDAYVSAAQEAQRQGMPKDFLPRGSGDVVSPLIAKIYLDAAGGNVDKAHKALLSAGYK